MDAFDLKILETLVANGRESHENIGRVLNLSRPAVHQRVKKLEDAGIIKKYQAMVDWSQLGQTINVIIYVKINATVFKNIISDILKITVTDTFLEECHRLAGEWCIILRIRSTSTQNLTNYIDELLKINGVVATSTTFILSTILQNGSAIIDSV